MGMGEITAIFVAMTFYVQGCMNSLLLQDENIHRSSAKNSLKSQKKFKQPPPKPAIFNLITTRNDLTLSNSMWQNCKERPTRSTNNAEIWKSKLNVTL